MRTSSRNSGFNSGVDSVGRKRTFTPRAYSSRKATALKDLSQQSQLTPPSGSKDLFLRKLPPQTSSVQENLLGTQDDALDVGLDRPAESKQFGKNFPNLFDFKDFFDDESGGSDAEQDNLPEVWNGNFNGKRSRTPEKCGGPDIKKRRLVVLPVPSNIDEASSDSNGEECPNIQETQRKSPISITDDEPSKNSKKDSRRKKKSYLCRYPDCGKEYQGRLMRHFRLHHPGIDHTFYKQGRSSEELVKVKCLACNSHISKPNIARHWKKMHAGIGDIKSMAYKEGVHRTDSGSFKNQLDKVLQRFGQYFDSEKHAAHTINLLSRVLTYENVVNSDMLIKCLLEDSAYLGAKSISGIRKLFQFMNAEDSNLIDKGIRDMITAKLSLISPKISKKKKLRTAMRGPADRALIKEQFPLIMKMLRSDDHERLLTTSIINRDNYDAILAAFAVEVVCRTGGRGMFLRNVTPSEIENAEFHRENKNHVITVKENKQTAEPGYFVVTPKTMKTLKALSLYCQRNFTGTKKALLQVNGKPHSSSTLCRVIKSYVFQFGVSQEVGITIMRKMTASMCLHLPPEEQEAVATAGGHTLAVALEHYAVGARLKAPSFGAFVVSRELDKLKGHDWDAEIYRPSSKTNSDLSNFWDDVPSSDIVADDKNAMNDDHCPSRGSSAGMEDEPCSSRASTEVLHGPRGPREDITTAKGSAAGMEDEPCSSRASTEVLHGPREDITTAKGSADSQEGTIKFFQLQRDRNKDVYTEDVIRYILVKFNAVITEGKRLREVEVQQTATYLNVGAESLREKVKWMRKKIQQKNLNK